MNKRHYEHTLPNIRGSLSNTYVLRTKKKFISCRQGINFLPARYLFFVSHVIDFLHDMLLIACALWNQLPVLRFSLASTEMMYPPLLFTLLQFVPLNIFQT